MTSPSTPAPRLAEHVARLLQTLQTWPWLDTLATLRQRFREDRLGITASSLTFTTLISLVPLVTVMLAVFSAFPMFSSFQESLQKYFLQSLVPDSIARPVLGALTQFAQKSKGIGTVGLVLLFGTALALMLTIDRTLNGIWRVRTPRPIAQRVLVYWATATLGPLVLGVSLSGTSYALSASRGLVSALPGGVSLLLEVIEFVLLALGLSALFHYVPNTHVRWRHALAGGVFVAVGIEGAKRALGWYLSAVPTYAVVYGAFATVPIFLVWIYVCWVIVLLGAVVAAYAPSLQMRVVRWPEGSGSRFHLAVAILRELARVRATPAHGPRLDEICTAMRADPLQVEPVLDLLVGIDWVGRLEEGDNPRHVLLCDPATTRAEPLLAQLLLPRHAGLAGLWQRTGLDALTVEELLVN